MDLQEVYINYANDIKRFLFCLTHNYDLSEELTQETFYQACKSIERYDGTCKMSVWLCQIAKHVFYDYLKKQKHYGQVGIDENFDFIAEENQQEVSLEDYFVIKEQAEDIIHAALNMKEPYSKIFLLRTLGEMSFKEIGYIFKKSDNWARVTYYRAKEMLNERVNHNESDM